MRVAVTSGEGIFTTGVKRYSDHLLPELRALGVDAEGAALKRRELRLGRRTFGGYFSIWAARLSGRPSGFDVVHALDISVAARGTDVATVHDLVVEMFPHWYQTTLGAKLDQRVIRAVARRCPWFIADTEATREEFVTRWKVAPERVEVVHLGIDPSHFRRVPTASPLVPDAKPTLVLLGDDNPRKNVQLAVDAAAVLRRVHGLDVRLVRVGARRWPAVSARFQRAAKDAGVELVEPGSIPDDELIPLLSRAQAMLWPSLAEGFGIPPLEAMACGAPVIALDTPVNREVCGPLTAYHPNDATLAAAAIQRTLRQPPSTASLRAYAETFSWTRTAEQTLAVYERIVQERKRQ